MNPIEESQSTISELTYHLHRKEHEALKLHGRVAPKIRAFFVIDRRVYRESRFKDLVIPGSDNIRWSETFEGLPQMTGSETDLRASMLHVDQCVDRLCNRPASVKDIPVHMKMPLWTVPTSAKGHVRPRLTFSEEERE